MSQDASAARAALHALGLLDKTESDDLLVHATPETLAELDSYTETASRIAELSAQEPPKSLKARLMDRIAPASDTNCGLPHGVVSLIRAHEGKWMPTPFPGITVKSLFVDEKSGNQSILVRMEPGSVYPSHHHVGLEHSLVLEGDAIFSDHTLNAGDYEVGDAGHDHCSITTKGGCLVFIMRNRGDHVLSAS
jgi:anti-sigma factor ChrR (cupin superfamily)